MQQKKTILVADDDASINQLLTNALASKFEVASASSGADTLTYCQQHKPDLILLDVNLGDIDGKEICKQIKQDYAPQAPLIIFISADDGQENIISCFENGADDFIGKPFSPAQVVGKVDALIKHNILVESLQSQSQELTNLVSTTMSQASSYGQSLQMVKQLNHANSEEEIANVVFSYLATQGLHAAIYFVKGEESVCFDQKSKVCSPIVKEVFELAHNKQRIKKLGGRLLVSDEHCSVLVMNPPGDESDEYSIFIDIIAVIIEALEARYIGYLRERELQSVNTELSKVITQLSVDVEKVRQDRQKLMDDIVMQIGLSFHQLDLTIEQEEYFTKLMEETLLNHDENNNVLMDLQDKLQHLVNEMKALLG